jgi:hypothetical protein
MNIYIDSENVPHTEYQTIINKYSQHNKPILSIKVFADWSSAQSKKWYDCCKRNILVEQKQCIKKPQKQTIDVNIITDVMNDILVDKQMKNDAIKEVIIVSSDMDFIPLLKTIKKYGILVECFTCDPFKPGPDLMSDTDIDIENVIYENREYHAPNNYPPANYPPANNSAPYNMKQQQEYLDQKFNLIRKCVENLKKSGVQCIASKKLIRALFREAASNVHERNMFKSEEEFYMYPMLIVREGAKWKLL